MAIIEPRTVAMSGGDRGDLQALDEGVRQRLVAERVRQLSRVNSCQTTL